MTGETRIGTGGTGARHARLASHARHQKMRRSAFARLVPALALCAAALPARADSPSLFGLTVNGDDIACASGEGWIFDGATVSLAGPGPFVLSSGGVSFSSNVAVVAQSECAVTF